MRGIDQSATTLGRRPRRRRTLTVAVVGLLLLAEYLVLEPIRRTLDKWRVE